MRKTSYEECAHYNYKITDYRADEIISRCKDCGANMRWTVSDVEPDEED